MWITANLGCFTSPHVENSHTCTLTVVSNCSPGHRLLLWESSNGMMIGGRSRTEMETLQMLAIWLTSLSIRIAVLVEMYCRAHSKNGRPLDLEEQPCTCSFSFEKCTCVLEREDTRYIATCYAARARDREDWRTCDPQG